MNTARNATGPDRANDQPRQDQNYQHQIFAPAEKIGKSYLTRDPHFQDLQQRFAVRGFVMNASATGSGVYVSRWGLVKFFDSLLEADSFAHQVGAV